MNSVESCQNCIGFLCSDGTALLLVEGEGTERERLVLLFGMGLDEFLGGHLMWRSPLITFSGTPLVLRLTLDPYRIIEQARAAHPSPDPEVKCRLARLVPT